MTDLWMINGYIDSLSINLSNDAIRLVIWLIHHPPNSNDSQFTKKLNDILGQVPYMPCYIMGDYSIDPMKHSLHPPTDNVLEATYANSLLPNDTKTNPRNSYNSNIHI